MAVDATLTPRKIYLEDIDYLEDPTVTQTASVNVLGATGNPQTLNKPCLLLLTSLTQAANDAAAASAGVNVGQAYWNTTTGALYTRQS